MGYYLHFLEYYCFEDSGAGNVHSVSLIRLITEHILACIIAIAKGHG